MDLWPPNVLCEGQHSKTSGMCGVDILQHSVFDRYRYGYLLIKAQAPKFPTHVPLRVDVWADLFESFFIIANDAISHLFQVGVLSSNFLLKILLIVSVIHRSSAVSMALVEGIASVLDELFVDGHVLENELSEKVTRAFVGVDLVDLVPGILNIAFME